MPNIFIPDSFKKVLEKKERDLQVAVLKTLTQLSSNPRHPGLNAHKIKGTDGVWEAYIDDANRVTFEYDAQGKIRMLNNCKHQIVDRA